MISEQTRALFPRKVVVTDAIIAKSDIYDCTNCIGYHSLVKSLKKTGLTAMSWGCISGRMIDENGRVITLTTEQDIDLTDITKRTQITFIISDPQPQYT